MTERPLIRSSLLWKIGGADSSARGHICERVKLIMLQDMCALIVVRDDVMESSAGCPGAEIIDCNVDFWVVKQCTLACDAACPNVPDPTGLKSVEKKKIPQVIQALVKSNRQMLEDLAEKLLRPEKHLEGQAPLHQQ